MPLHQPDPASYIRVPADPNSLILTSQRAPPSGPGIVDAGTFATRWTQFTGGALAGLDWTNLFAAGGAVLACLIADKKEAGDTADSFRDSDVDLFVTGAADEAAANAVLRRVIACIEGNIGHPVDIVRTHRAVTILGKFPVRHIQVILKMHPTPEDVLEAFDLDCCTVGYDGSKLAAQDRFRRAIRMRYNIATADRRSRTFETRLVKYARRGFAVLVPGLDLSMVDFAALGSWSRTPREGLAKLLAVEARQRKYQGRIRMYVSGGTGANYGIHIPYHRWSNMRWVLSSLDRTDQSQFFSAMHAASRAARKPGQVSQPGQPKMIHRHLFVRGIEVEDAKKSSWCRLCKENKAFEETSAPYVAEVLVWDKHHTNKQDFDHGFVRTHAGGVQLEPVVHDWFAGVYKEGTRPARSAKPAMPVVPAMVAGSPAASLEHAMGQLSLGSGGILQQLEAPQYTSIQPVVTNLGSSTDPEVAKFQSSTLSQSWDSGASATDLAAFGGPTSSSTSSAFTGASAMLNNTEAVASTGTTISTGVQLASGMVPSGFQRQAPSSGAAGSASGEAHGLAMKAQTLVGRALVLVGHLSRSGKVNDQFRSRVKNLALRGDGVILGAAEAFALDGQLDELLDTWSIRVNMAV